MIWMDWPSLRLDGERLFTLPALSYIVDGFLDGLINDGLKKRRRDGWYSFHQFYITSTLLRMDGLHLNMCASVQTVGCGQWLSGWIVVEGCCEADVKESIALSVWKRSVYRQIGRMMSEWNLAMKWKIGRQNDEWMKSGNEMKGR